MPEPEDSHEGQARKRSRVDGRAPHTYPRKRALVACHTCRAKKTKCDNQRPSCGSCLSLGAHCSYADTVNDHSTFDAASLAILERVNYAVSLLESQTEHLEQRPAIRSGPEQTPLSWDSAEHSANAEPAAEDEAHEIELLESSVSSKTSARNVLAWPIFEGKYDPQYLDTAVFSHPVPDSGVESACTRTDSHEPVEVTDLQSALRSIHPSRGVQEEDAPELIEAFLENVHIKNPILDSTDLRKWGKSLSEHGFGWTARSCLLLVVCALGAISSKFSTTSVSDPRNHDSGSKSIQDTKNYSTAERYYCASRKRIGLLGHSLLAAQCMFLSGIYEMYSLRPVQAWTSFSRAAGVLQVYVIGRPDSAMTQISSAKSLEHRLYWSCLKSISEIREELPLPASGLGQMDYPLFPALPNVDPDARLPEDERPVIGGKCWFYYLAEITSRRIANRILNSFYKISPASWPSLNIDNVTRVASDLEVMIQQWFDHLPDQVRCDGSGRPEDELGYMLQGRAAHLYAFLYRPFLYIAIHHPRPATIDPRVQFFAQKSVNSSMHRMSLGPIKHRHHGSWFTGRSLFTDALAILAAVKSGMVNVPVGWNEKIHLTMSFLGYWETEAPDLGRSRKVLEQILDDLNTTVGS